MTMNEVAQHIQSSTQSFECWMIAFAFIASAIMILPSTDFYANRLLKDDINPKIESRLEMTLFGIGMVLFITAALGATFGGSLMEKKITEEHGVQRIYVQNQSNHSKSQAFRSFRATLPKDAVPEVAFVEQLEKQDSNDYQHEYLPIEEVAEYEINEQFNQEQFLFEALD